MIRPYREPCSVLITNPAFGPGSAIRRGPRRGGGAFEESPAQALGGVGRTGCRGNHEGVSEWNNALINPD